MLILYDDTAPAPASIRQIIGVEHFGDVLRRKRRLSEVIEQLVNEIGEHKFVRATDTGRCLAEIDLLERQGDSQVLFRLPSSLMPVNLKKFALTLRKLPYSLDQAIFGGRFDDEAAALLTTREASTLLMITDPKKRRAYFVGLAERGVQIDNAIGLVDLRDIGSFLAYMIGATETRHFNATHVSGGVFRKSSTDKAKMRAEYAYFNLVPEAMRRFLLPGFDFREDGDRASYAMENLSIPDAALQMVHHSFDPASFGRLLDRFFEFIAARAEKHIGVEAVRDVARIEILKKYEQRLDQFMATDAGRRVDTLLGASGPYGSIATMRRHATLLVERAITADLSAALATSHGDPCLSNILFNREIGIFRLVDPRGATTFDEAFMHPLYDIAKFSHSVLGGYDFINNGLFECRLDHDLQLILELDGGGPPSWMRAAFQERLAAKNYDIATIRGYELSLFLSMLPLHIDVPRKLPAFCLAAAKIMAELDGEK